MTTIQTAYFNARLADASYMTVTASMGVNAIVDATKDRLTPTQAAYLAANFTILSSVETSAWRSGWPTAVARMCLRRACAGTGSDAVSAPGPRR
jgi:hypothetical protein